MKVPFVDLYALHVPLKSELTAIFQRVLENGSFVLGPEVQQFEDKFAEYIGVEHAVALNSGTSALQLALMAVEVGPGDEVITAANTFIATAEAITAVGARPVFVDVDPQYYNINSAAVARAVTSRTRVVIPVHLYGQTADMPSLLQVAREHRLIVIEDACQAHGAECDGRKAGSMGLLGCFSFYPTKNLGALGEGGAVVCNDARLAQQIRMLRDHGSVKKYEHWFPGYNLRLEGLQGAFLTAKLPYLEAQNESRRAAAHLYSRLLAHSSVVTPATLPGAKPVYHLFVIQTDRRDALKQYLADQGVETGLHYPVPLHLQKAYAALGYKLGDFPVSESLATRILSLPMFPTITQEQIEYVSLAVLEFTKSRAAGA